MGLQEKEMEIGFAGFLFFVWSGGAKKKKKKEKSESGNVLAGQAGMEVIDWRRIVMLV